MFFLIIIFLLLFCSYFAYIPCRFSIHYCFTFHGPSCTSNPFSIQQRVSYKSFVGFAFAFSYFSVLFRCIFLHNQIPCICHNSFDSLGLEQKFVVWRLKGHAHFTGNSRKVESCYFGFYKWVRHVLNG